MKTDDAFTALTGHAAPTWADGPLGQVAPIFRAAWDQMEHARLAQADRRADDLAGMTLDMLRRRLAQHAENDVERSTVPAITRMDLWRVARGESATQPGDQGLRHMAQYAKLLWQMAPQGTLAVRDCARIRRHYAMFFPSSTAGAVMEKAVRERGALSIPLQRVAELATQIVGATQDARQASYNDLILRNGLVGTSDDKIRVRAFLLALAQTEPPGDIPAPPGEGSMVPEALPHDEASEVVQQMVSPNSGSPVTVEIGVPSSQPPTASMNDVAPPDYSTPLPPPNGASGHEAARYAQATPAVPPPTPDDVPPADEPPGAPGQTTAVVPDPTAKGQQLRVVLESDPGAGPQTPMDGPVPDLGGAPDEAGGTLQTGMGAFAAYAVEGHRAEPTPMEVIAAASLDVALGHVAERLGAHASSAVVMRRSPLMAYVVLDAHRGQGIRIAAQLPGRTASELPKKAEEAAHWLDEQGFVPIDVLCGTADHVLSGEDDLEEARKDAKDDVDAAKGTYSVGEMMGSADEDASAAADLDALLEEAKGVMDQFFDALSEVIEKEGFRDPRLVAVRTSAGTSAGDVERALLAGQVVERLGVTASVQHGDKAPIVRVASADRADTYPMSRLDEAIAQWQSRVAVRLPPPHTLRASAGAVELRAPLPDVARARPALGERVAAWISSCIPDATTHIDGTHVHVRLASGEPAVLARIRRALADRFGMTTLEVTPVAPAAPVAAAHTAAAAAPPSPPVQHPPPVLQPDMRPDPSGYRPPAEDASAATEHAQRPSNVQPSMGMPATASADGEGIYDVQYRQPDGSLGSTQVLAASPDVAVRIVAHTLSVPFDQFVAAARAPVAPPAPARPQTARARVWEPRSGQLAPPEPGALPTPPVDAPGALPGASAAPPQLGLDQVQITPEDREIIRSGLIHYRTTRKDIDEAISLFRKEYEEFLLKFGEEGSPGRQVVGGVLVSTAMEVYAQPAQVAVMAARQPLGTPGAPARHAFPRVAAMPTPGTIRPDHPSGVTVPKMLGDTEQASPRAMQPRVNKPGAGGAATKIPSGPGGGLGKDRDNDDVGRFKAPLPRADGRVKFDGAGWGQSWPDTSLGKDTEQNVPKVLKPKVV